MATLGQDLKKEREMRGISLKEIGDSTKIGMRFLRAIEEDQINILPGKFFTKGILRSYADYLGLEEYDILNRFQQEEQDRLKLKDSVNKTAPNQKKGLRKVKNILIFIFLVTILAATLYAFYYFSRKENNSTTTEKIIPTAVKQESNKNNQVILPQEILNKEELNLKLSFHEPTWIQILADKELVLDGNQLPGFKFEVKASKEFIINCGNCGGFTFTVNEQPGKKIGISGSVKRNILINRDNLNQYIQEKKLTTNQL